MLAKLPLELLDLCCFWAAAVPVNELGLRPLEAEAVPSRPQQSSLLSLALTSKTLFPIAIKYLYLAPYLDTIEDVERFVKTISQKPDVKECYLSDAGRARTAPINHRAAWYCGFVLQLTMLGWPASVGKSWPERKVWRRGLRATGEHASTRLRPAVHSVLQKCVKLETIYAEPFGDRGFSNLAHAAENCGFQVISQPVPGIRNGGARFLKQPFNIGEYLGVAASPSAYSWTNGVLSWAFDFEETMMENLQDQDIGQVTDVQLRYAVLAT